MIDGNENYANTVTFRKDNETGDMRFGLNESADLGFIQTELDVTWDEDEVEHTTEFFIVHVHHASSTHVVSIFEKMSAAVRYARAYCLLLRAAGRVMIHMDTVVFTDKWTTQEISLTIDGNIRRMTRCSLDRAVTCLQETVNAANVTANDTNIPF